MILFSPDKMSDTGAKDDFANKVRLITESYTASAVVLVVESWISKARPGEKLDTEMPPSESCDCEVVVVLIGQSPQGNITHLLPIHRLDNGKFWSLGDAEDMPTDSFNCRFANLLPAKPVDDKGRSTTTTSTSGTKTTFRDAQGRTTGTASQSSTGKTTYRDAQGRLTGTATVKK